MTPNADHHNPAPAYIRQLLKAAGLSPVEAAERLGVSERAMRNYVSETSKYRAPYTVQFALEALASAGAVSADVPAFRRPPSSEWFTWREVTDDDVRKQAPAGLEFAQARLAVLRKISKRLDQLPEFMQRSPRFTASEFPLEAIEPERFKVVMAVLGSLKEVARQGVAEKLAWRWERINEARYPLHRLVYVARLISSLSQWRDDDVIDDTEFTHQRGKAYEVEDGIMEELAEKARAYDPSLVPWAYSPTPEPLPDDVPGYILGSDYDRVRVMAARAEWKARELEKLASRYLNSAASERAQYGGQAVTAAALESIPTCMLK